MNEISREGSSERNPARDGLDVRGRDAHAVLVPEDVLEQHPQGVRQPVNVELGLQSLDPEDLVLGAADRESRLRAEGVRVVHRPRFKQLGPVQPVEGALRERCSPGVEVTPDRRRVGRADPAGVGREALVAHWPQILRVRVEQMLAADLARRVEEREPDSCGDLEKRALLPVRLRPQAGVGRCELRWRRKPTCVGAQVGQRLLERFDLKRWDVDQPCGRAAGSFERTEQVVDRSDIDLPCEDTRRLQLADEGVEVHACPVRHVRGRREQPERGEAEGENRAELDDVPARLANRELLRRLLELALDQLPWTLDRSDQLDGDPEQVLGGRFVQPRLADEAW